MFITKMSLPRRTFLRGIGVTVTLPLLEAMVPALTATAQTAANPVRRFGAVYVPHGKILDQWTPAGDGAGFAFTPILKPLEAHRAGWWGVGGLDAPRGPAAGGHATAPAMWLTGGSPKKTEGVDVRNDTTIDQLIAQAIGQEKPFPHLELATAHDGGVPRLEGGRRRRVQRHLQERHRVGRTDGAAADGNQSARRLRAAVRRHR